MLSPKIVRLEKYELPASDEASTPRLDNLSYLADYAYSEVPPEKKPADIVLDALKDIPIGKPIEEIKLASQAFGLDCGIGATVHVLQYRTEILQLLSKVHGWIRLFLRRQDFLSAYPINKVFSF